MNIIEQLKNIKVEDLKNINIAQIKEWVKFRPDIFVNVLMIGLTLFATIQIFSWHQSKLKKLNEEIALMNDRLESLDEEKTIKKNYEGFLKTFPPFLTREQLSSKFSDFAILNKIQILSFNPSDSKSNKYFTLDSYRLTLLTENYNSIVSFVKAIENSTASLRISRWSTTINEDYLRAQEENEKPRPFEVNLELEVVRLNES